MFSITNHEETQIKTMMIYILLHPSENDDDQKDKIKNKRDAGGDEEEKLGCSVGGDVR